MPIHHWRGVEAGIFHAFHHDWITEISRSLNHGLLPPDYYALPEQIAGGLGPDVLTLKAPIHDDGGERNGPAGLALSEAPPKVQLRFRAEPDRYAAQAKSVVVRHASGNRVIAIIEIVSPGNKSSRNGIREFVKKAVEIVRGGVHLLIIDLLPPGPRDPNGIHKAIWDEFVDNDFVLLADKPLTLASYRADDWPEAFVELCAPSSRLIEMPLFLSSETYVQVPLEPTYQATFENLPAYVKNEITAGRP